MPFSCCRTSNLMSQPSRNFDFLEPNLVILAGTSFSGTLSWSTCFRFNTDTSVDYAVSLTDDADQTSNTLAIRVPKPIGAPTSASPSSVSAMRPPGG